VPVSVLRAGKRREAILQQVLVSHGGASPPSAVSRARLAPERASRRRFPR
jgi:hypothetical protein